MKLLIVDDEELTREGLLGALDWKKLGIDEIFLADDGVNGLKMAQEHQPELVLCDVRMPRMTGIDMLRAIQKKHPDVTGIFMSGYSDKEYLKSAIQLQAVDYIEKPIQSEELESAIKRAIQQADVASAHLNTVTQRESVFFSQLAYLMTLPYEANAHEIREMIHRLEKYRTVDQWVFGTTIIIKQRRIPEQTQTISELISLLNAYLKQMHMSAICTEKHVFHLVFHIFSVREPQAGTMDMIADKIASLLGDDNEFCIAIGSTEKSPDNVFRSYQNAVILLQHSFFWEKGTILKGSDLPPLDINAERENEINRKLTGLSAEFEEGISQQKKERAENSMKELEQVLHHNLSLMTNQVKSIYYDLFMVLYRARQDKKLIPDRGLEDRTNIMDIMEDCFTYHRLHELLKEKTYRYFTDSESDSSENPTITIIRDYIGDNYGNPALSVKMISDYVKMSTSYLCTFFKNETGTTLNQYITDYRIRKAKLLLTDPRNRISDISSQVGYNDGNYFAKTFRKSVGLSPSEYREQVIGS